MRKPMTHAQLTDLWSEVETIEQLRDTEEATEADLRDLEQIMHRIQLNERLIKFLERGFRLLDGGKADKQEVA